MSRHIDPALNVVGTGVREGQEIWIQWALHYRWHLEAKSIASDVKLPTEAPLLYR
jgi:hypothetical protein